MKGCVLTLAAGAAFLAGNTQAAPPVSDYARWFDASTLGLSNSAGVTTWPDGSLNAATATVPSGNATPVYVANAGTETGLGAVYFVGNSGANNSAALKFTEDAAIRTVFSVFKGSSFLLTDTSQFHFHRPTDNDPTSPLYNGNTSGYITGGSTYVNSTLVNGTSYAMPTALHNGFNLVEVLTTGNVQVDSFNKDRTYHAGNQYQAEVIIYNRVLSEDERVQVEHYLNTKWFGITYAPDAKITNFGPGATVGQPSGGVASIAWTLPSWQSPASLAPTFALSPGATCTVNSNPVSSGTTLNLTNPVHFIVTSSDGLVTNEYTVTATVSGLPAISGLNAWYDSSTGVTTSGTTVTGWNDQSGNGHNATTGTGTPVFAASQVNGKPAVQFRGNNLLINSNITPGQEFIVFRSGRYSFDSGNPSYWGSDWGGPIGQQNDSGWMLQGGSRQMWDGNMPNQVTVNGTNALKSGNNWQFSNNVNQYMVLKVNPVNSGSALGRLGRPNNSWGNGELDVAEVIVYTSPLSEDDEDRVGGYLANKYGLTTAYPPVTPSAIMKRFGTSGNPGFINEAAHTIDWYVPYGTDVTTLAPPYKLVYGATCNLASGSTQNFTNPVTYTVTSSDSLIVQPYTVTVHSLPNWPTMINVNYSGGANGNLNSVYSFDFVGRGNAASVAPANYAGSTWTDATSSTASGSNLKDSQGNTTSVGFTTSCNAGPWGDWNMLGAAKISHAVAANYTVSTPVFALNGLNTGHIYDIYVASSHNNANIPADWQVGTAVKHLANTTGESTNWVEGKNFIHFTNLIPLANGTITVKASGNGNYDGIDLNAFQVQDMGARGLNPEAFFYAFSFPGTGVSATSINGTNISVTMYTGTDVSALRPTFTTSAGATVTAAGTAVVSGDARNFGSPVHYLVTSEDASTTTDYTVTVNLVPSSGHVNVNLDNTIRTGLYGPAAAFSGLGKTWNKAINVKTGSNLLDEDGVVTTIGFNFNNVDGGPGAWGNPSLDLIKGGLYTFSTTAKQGEINGLIPGKTYNLYIASYWADQWSQGTFTVNGATQDLSGQGNTGAAWIAGVNYAYFQNVVVDSNGKILVSLTASGGKALMISGFQLLDSGIKSPYCNMLTFGPGATISGTNITWVTPSGTNLAAAAPAFTTSGLATVTVGGNPVVSGATVNLSAGPVHYIVTAEDGSHFTDYTVTASVAMPPVATGLVCWYDAGAGVTVNSGVVQSWSDLSGNGRIATQGGGTVTLTTGDVNSRSAVHLRSGGFMNATTVPFTSIVKEQYVVVRSPNATWTAGSFFGRKSDTFLSVRGSSYNMANGTTGFWQDHYPSAVSKNGRTISLDSASGSGYRGIAPITDYMILKIVVDNDGVGNIGTYPYYQIGKNETTGTMDFDVAEILGFNNSGATLSSADSNTVTAYLAQKYGVAVAIPTSLSNLTASQSIGAGTSSVTLSGTVSAPGSIYPAAGELVAVTINGVTQNATVSGTSGNFSVDFPTGSIPTSATPYPITYSYAGNTTLLGAAPNNSSTTLTVTAAVAGYANWASQHVGSQTAEKDYNHDGVQNGIAYFMGATGVATLPGIVNGKIAWPHDAAAVGITWKVRTSQDLQNWTDVTVDAVDAGGFVTYTLPKTTLELFVRLEVTAP